MIEDDGHLPDIAAGISSVPATAFQGAASETGGSAYLAPAAEPVNAASTATAAPSSAPAMSSIEPAFEQPPR